MVLKTSEYSRNTSAALKRLVSDTFDPDYITLLEGGAEVNTALLSCRFGHIFFTGSPRVGRLVMKAAAEHLTPVTLELGGKSPAIVDETAAVPLAARRIMWGKLINAGQTCVAPDYVLCDSRVKEELLGELVRLTRELYGDDPIHNPEYCRIINRDHFHRLQALLSDGEVVLGGGCDEALQKIEPTILRNVPPDSPVMRDEIFGPILPVLEYKTFSEAVDFVKSREKPLALYLFTSDPQREQRVVNEVPFGGGCINDTVVHLTNPNLGFGGVGESGMGAYHGRRGFETFSHEKSVLKKSTRVDIAMRYPPYQDRLSQIKKLMK